MRILLDECVPWPFHHFLSTHTCTTAQTRGWGGSSNGELLRLAEAEFDLFVISDQNLRYQQNLAKQKIAILELSTNDIRRLRAAANEILAAINEMAPGQFRRLEIA
jgi:hypothetical protein